MKTTNPTLQAIDLLIEDFPVETLASYFYDIFKNHIRESDGYDHEALADQFEIGHRLLDILKDREREIKTAKKHSTQEG